MEPTSWRRMASEANRWPRSLWGRRRRLLRLVRVASSSFTGKHMEFVASSILIIVEVDE